MPPSAQSAESMPNFIASFGRPLCATRGPFVGGCMFPLFRGGFSLSTRELSGIQTVAGQGEDYEHFGWSKERLVGGLAHNHNILSVSLLLANDPR